MMRLEVDAADTLSDRATRTGLIFAAAILFFTLISALVAWGLAAALAPDKTGWIVAGVFALGGMGVALALVRGLERAFYYSTTIVDAWWGFWEAEILAKKPAKEPAQPPAHEAQTVPVTSGVKEPAEIGGFDKADLLALCRAFAAGMKWTEDKMVGFTLPHTQETLTKARYIALMALFVERGVIDGRGGPGNKTGKLLIADPNEAYARLVNEAPALSGEPSKKNGAA